MYGKSGGADFLIFGLYRPRCIVQVGYCAKAKGFVVELFLCLLVCSINWFNCFVELANLKIFKCVLSVRL